MWMARESFLRWSLWRDCWICACSTLGWPYEARVCQSMETSIHTHWPSKWLRGTQMHVCHTAQRTWHCFVTTSQKPRTCQFPPFRPWNSFSWSARGWWKWMTKWTTSLLRCVCLHLVSCRKSTNMGKIQQDSKALSDVTEIALSWSPFDHHAPLSGAGASRAEFFEHHPQLSSLTKSKRQRFERFTGVWLWGQQADNKPSSHGHMPQYHATTRRFTTRRIWSNDDPIETYWNLWLFFRWMLSISSLWSCAKCGE